MRCEIGRDCFVQNYVDADPTPDRKDYTCGPFTYDGHKGTDIRVPDLAAMQRGVTVVAAAAGTVRAIRDEMPDISIRDQAPGAVANREAGNAVVVVHPGGWEAQYSHLKRGSVVVKPGDTVAVGQPLGQIGLSGNTEFPHLHFELRRNGQPVDPFVGPDDPPGCGQTGTPLWSKAALQALAYRPGALLAAGFLPGPPTEAAARSGPALADSLPRSAPALVFWTDTMTVLAGDTIALRLLGPDGAELAKSDIRVERPRANQSAFVGRKQPQGGWPQGRYVGEYRLTRGGATVAEARRTLTVD